jgi:hypothetical protein
MWKTMVPIVAGLGLSLAVPAPATEKVERRESADGLVGRTVVLKGRLRHVEGEKTREPPIPFEYWTVHADGGTYYLDLRGKELRELAAKLVNRPVVVTGIPEPASPTVRVTSLKADEGVKQTIHVAIRGRLEALREGPLPAETRPWPGLRPWPEGGLVPRPRPWPPAPGPIVGWRIVLGEKSYQLEFGSRDELRELAKRLDGKGVVVTGTRVGGVVHVSGMRADEGTYRETVTVEIQGVLGRTFVEMDVWLNCYPPKYGGKVKCPAGWEITAAGTTYTLDFSSHPELEKVASQLANKAVVVTGTRKGSVVTVTGVRPANPDTFFELSAPLSLVESRF